MDTKRVGCLYRVSTLKQVEKNDIPMQRISCENFIKSKSNWKLTKEYIELGVSGYKISESKRDALQDMKKDVQNKKIDILLVFMFDRIGRKEEETPFVVEWLIDRGIEVWSVKEGQRKIENRADKLINYLTYWQAGGESEKTSIRVREVQKQMAEQGILTYGGKRNQPYGYTFIKSGTFTKKGVERQKLIINQEEAKIVKDIFELYAKKRYGIGRIAKYLNNKKIKPRRSELWSVSTVGKMLTNPIYMGYPAYRKKTTVNVQTAKKQSFENWILPEKKRSDIAIISEELWYEVKRIRDNRNLKNNVDVDIETNIDIKPRQTNSKLLFIGMCKCGECGYAFMTAGSKKKRKNGEVIKYHYYRCSSTRSSNFCNLEKKSIRKEDLEEVILKCVYDFLDSLAQTDLSKAIKKGLLNNCEEEEKQLKSSKEELKEVEENLTVLKNEVIKTITGKSNFSEDLLNELITEKENLKEKLISKIANMENKIRQKSLEDKEMLEIKDKIPVWKEEFKNADIEVQKMLLSEIIKEVRVFNDRYEIDFKIQLNNYFKEKINIQGNHNQKYESVKFIENTTTVLQYSEK